MKNSELFSTTQEAISTEMIEAIKKSAEVQKTLSELTKVVSNYKAMEQSLKAHNKRKIEIGNRKKELKKSFGDNPESDFKELTNLVIEGTAIYEAIGFLDSRLQAEGERAVAEKECNFRVSSSIASALSPVKAKYQAMADDLLKSLADLLVNYSTAILSTWPTITPEGISLTPDVSIKQNCLIEATDVARLRPFTSELNC